MTAFAGIVTFDGASGEKQSEEQIAKAVGALRKGRVSTGRLDGAVFVQRTDISPPGVPSPIECDDGRSLFSAVARLDNREELGAALRLTPADLTRTADTVLLRRMFERWGSAGIARCLGAFAFAHWEAGAHRLILGRDCLGNCSLFFHRGRGFATFATRLGALLAMPGVPRELDELTLANFMVVNLGEARRTFYRGIERVPSRTLVTIDRDGIRHRHYWSPDLDASPLYRQEKDYVERARELFDQAVAAATADTRDVAIATSGGLDSSAIAATVARLGGAERVACYTLVPPAGSRIDVGPFRYLDERDKVQALGRMYPALELNFLAPDKLHPVDEDDTRYFARTSLPVLGPAALGVFAFLQDAVAAAGHRRLLVGSHGNFGLTWSGKFSLRGLLSSGRWRGFAEELFLSAQQSGRGIVSTLASEVAVPGAPEGLRRLVHRLRRRDPENVSRFSGLNPTFIVQHDLARQWRAQGFDPWFAAPGWNASRHRAYHLFDHNQFGRDTKAMFAEHYGFELRDPHADRRLLEFALSVPEPMYRRNGIPRAFARAVLADRLPREILDERRRGAQSVTWFRRLSTRRQDVAKEIERLDSSPLARRLIDLPRLKRLMSEWPKDEHGAEQRSDEFKLVLMRGVHIGRFVHWVEGGNG